MKKENSIPLVLLGFIVLAGCTSPPSAPAVPTPAPTVKTETPASTDKQLTPATQKPDFVAQKPSSSQKDLPKDKIGVAELETLLASGDPVLAKIGTKELHSSDLAAPLFFHSAFQANELLRKLVNDEIARREAERYGITVSTEQLEKGIEEAFGTLRKQVNLEYAGKRTLEQFLEQDLRISLKNYEKALRRFVLERLFFERVLRYDQMKEPRVVCRVITVKEKMKAEELMEQLRAGADFEVLARQESIAPNRDLGGRLPPFGPDYDHPITELAFQTNMGALAGPMEEKRGNETFYHLIRVIEKIPGGSEPYSEVEAKIRKGLEEKPIEEWEYFYWSRKMEKRYQVQYLERP